MERYTLCIPTLFGLEGLVGDEMRRMQMQNVRVEDRRVFFEGDFAGYCPGQPAAAAWASGS